MKPPIVFQTKKDSTCRLLTLQTSDLVISLDSLWKIKGLEDGEDGSNIIFITLSRPNKPGLVQVLVPNLNLVVDGKTNEQNSTTLH